jgi:hypothetical protein
VVQQHLQQLLPAPVTAQQQHQQEGIQEGVGSSSTEPLLATATPAPALTAAAVPACLLSWGMWSMLQLLVLAQVGWDRDGSHMQLLISVVGTASIAQQLCEAGCTLEVLLARYC